MGKDAIRAQTECLPGMQYTTERSCWTRKATKVQWHFVVLEKAIWEKVNHRACANGDHFDNKRRIRSNTHWDLRIR